MPANLAKDFTDKFSDLQKQKGNDLSIFDIENLLHGIKKDNHQLLFEGIRDIAGKINSVKIEIHGDHHEITGSLVPSANLELDEVVKHTEEAANRIMDAAEAIRALAQTTDASLNEKLSMQVTEIFEASNFQDITGQRIRKVIKTLVDIEVRVTELIDAISGKVDVTNKKIDLPIDPNKALMNGPQLTKETPSQDDIDKLFAQS